MRALIIGGVAGGATAAARLRRLDEHAEIIIFERGEHISFANCGLPYYVGDIITDKQSLLLQSPEGFGRRFNIDVRVLSEVISIDRENKTVTVKDTKTKNTYTESYDKLIISTGAEPIRPAIKGIDTDGIFTLRNVSDTLEIKNFIQNKKPTSAVVVGGGYIGVEMAENLALAGLKVSLIELSDHLIAPLDFEMAVHVHDYIESKGIKLYLNSGVREISENGGKFTVSLDDTKIDCDMVILSVGVSPDTKLARDCGLKVNERGAIIVNPNMLTSDQNIYAVGDAVEAVDFVTRRPAYVPLAGPANKQGRIAADNICGIASSYTGTQGSSILKLFDMTIAKTGINEAFAKLCEFDYDKVYLYSNSHADYYPGATTMVIKVIFEKPTGKILGAQLIGFDGVDKRCDVLATVIRLGGTAHDLTQLELCYAPPFGSAKDPVNMAGYVIENILTNKVKNFHWHDIEKLPKDGSVTLLDTRTRFEYNKGHIEGFINIPLDELRDRINELDKSKPVYVHCLSGYRSYIACRILEGHGFETYNLSGGYRLYHTVMKHKNR
ncbi:MAG TPA: FAD-dependent oxidoreductase [Clostridiales bacterium]|nr:FAD-dependent oxidoreductase [Clostridiales bacterium]